MIDLMYKDSVLSIIRDMISIEDINQDDNLSEDLGFDSLTIFYLYVSLEEHFQIQINEDDLDTNKLKTVNDVFNLVTFYLSI